MAATRWDESVGTDTARNEPRGYVPRLIGLAGGCVDAEVRPLLVGLGVGARAAGPRVPPARVPVPTLGAARPTLGGGGVTPRGGGRELRNAGVVLEESSRRAPLPRPGGIERVR